MKKLSSSLKAKAWRNAARVVREHIAHWNHALGHTEEYRAQLRLIADSLTRRADIIDRNRRRK